MKELCDSLAHNDEIEFTYRGNSYTIEPGGKKADTIFSIWKSASAMDSEAEIICELSGNPDEEVNEDLINKFLKIKCFDGLSFLDIEADVIVEAVY